VQHKRVAWFKTQAEGGDCYCVVSKLLRETSSGSGIQGSWIWRLWLYGFAPACLVIVSLLHAGVGQFYPMHADLTDESGWGRLLVPEVFDLPGPLGWAN